MKRVACADLMRRSHRTPYATSADDARREDHSGDIRPRDAMSKRESELLLRDDDRALSLGASISAPARTMM